MFDDLINFFKNPQVLLVTLFILLLLAGKLFNIGIFSDGYKEKVQERMGSNYKVMRNVTGIIIVVLIVLFLVTLFLG